MDTLRSRGLHARDYDRYLWNPLSQPGIVWTTVSPPDLPAAVRVLKLRRADAGGLLELTQRRFGPVTGWCVLGDNVIGAASWSRLTFEEQYQAVTERAAGFVASAMCYLRVEGPDAAAALDRLSPRTVSDLLVGQARFTLFTTPAGTIDEEAVIVRTAPDVFLMSCGGGKPPGWLASVARKHPRFRVESTPLGSFNIKGPRRLESVLRLVAETDGAAVASLRPFETCEVRTAHGHPARILRTIIGYEVWAHAEILAATWDLLLADYPRTVPCAWDLLNTYRMECTEIPFALYPVDIHAGISLVEANYGWMLGHAEHDFIGKAALAARPEPRLRLVGLEAREKVAPPAIGEEVAVGDETFAGYVTSAARSPLLGRPLAFAHLRSGLAAGMEVVVNGSPWTVRDLPILKSLPAPAPPRKRQQVDAIVPGNRRLLGEASA